MDDTCITRLKHLSAWKGVSFTSKRGEKKTDIHAFLHRNILSKNNQDAKNTSS